VPDQCGAPVAKDPDYVGDCEAQKTASQAFAMILGAGPIFRARRRQRAAVSDLQLAYSQT
jgi:hypothetical protein